MRQKSNNEATTQATTLEILQGKVYDDSDLFCAFGTGLAIGCLIGLTFSCIILL